MRITRTTCDRCNATIEVNRAVLTLEAGPSLPWATNGPSGRPTLDLCEVCVAAMVEWLAPPQAVKAAG
jgi:hypothetical protein